MTLQSSASAGDPLRFSEIQAEFAPQGSAGNFRAYLKGAGIVDNVNDVAPNVPTGGTMNFQQFLSAQCVAFSGYTNTFISGTGTIIAPVGAVSVVIKVWGGGGGGGGGDTANFGGGGGGGGFVIKTMAVTGGSTQFTYSVGTGGAFGGYNLNGTSGTSSTITGGATLTAGGGTRGVRGSSGGAGGAGGTTSGGDAGSEAGTAGGSSGGNGGNAGGTSYGGGSGGLASSGAGDAPGGGGGGGLDDAGGPGARGEIRFEWS